MRIVFIFGVLLNHTTSAFAQNMADDSFSKLFLHATHLALHFTRMGFMFMTGLVLFLNYYERPNNWLQFWKKRYSSVGPAYLAWNAILILITSAPSLENLTFAKLLSNYYDAVIHGDRFYLYYVFVTFQLYLLFPLLVKLFKHFKNSHRFIVAVSLLLQLSLLIFIKYFLPNFDRSSWPYIFKSYGLNIAVYQVYFIVGAYTAIHYQAVERFLQKRRRQIFWLTGGLSLGTVGLYFFNRNILHLSFSRTELVHQPYIMLYALFMVATVFLSGRIYAQKRTAGLNPVFDHFVNLGAKVSFGVYLSQTIPLLLLYGMLHYLNNLPAWLLLLLLPVGYLLVAGGSFFIALFCYRVSPFGFLIGRNNWKKKGTVQ